MKQNKVKNHIKQILFEIIGSILIAIGIYTFAVNAEFPLTGLTGISIILYHVFHCPIGVSTILMNIPLSLVCYKLLGRKFFFSSLRCMVISSLLIDYVAPLFPAYQGERLLAALCTGLFAGLGYGLIYMVNSSTGGSDFILMTIKALNPHVPVGKITFVLDAITIGIGTLYFKDIDGIIYGMIVTFLLSIVVDKLMYGINSGKMALIVTDHAKEVCDAIDTCVGRGTTILHAQGGYKQDARKVVMCACNNKEMYLVQQTIKDLDPKSFMIVLESNEVHGEGFKTIQVGAKQS